MKLKALWTASIALAVSAIAATASQAAIMTIDFSGFAAGTPIDSTYAADGLVFSGAEFLQCGGGCPAPNPVSGWFAYGITGNTYTAFFTLAQSNISFQTVSNSSTLAQAYNASNTLVASVGDNEGFPISSQLDQLTGSGITHVVFSYNGGANGPAITNLTFNAGTVPEPAAWAMMLCGFAAVGAAMRSRRKVALITA